MSSQATSKQIRLEYITTYLYLIDTGVLDEQMTIFKFGQTSHMRLRMAAHRVTWKDMKLIYAVKVIEPLKCERQFREMCNNYLYTGSLYTQKELLLSTCPEHFITCMKQVALDEMNENGLNGDVHDSIEDIGGDTQPPTPSELLNNYENNTRMMHETVDLSIDGTSQKTFHIKYDSVLHNIVLYLMATQLIPKPALITLEKHDEHQYYYSNKGLHCDNIVFPLKPLHHEAIKNMKKEYPDRIYLFHSTTTIPSMLSSKEKSTINSYFSHLIKKYDARFSMSMFKNARYQNELLTNQLALFIQSHNELSELKNEKKRLIEEQLRLLDEKKRSMEDQLRLLVDERSYLEEQRDSIMDDKYLSFTYDHS